MNLFQTCVVALWLAFMVSPVVSAQSQGDIPASDSFPSSWKAGSVVDDASVKQFGIDKCFVAEPVNDIVVARISGKSYKKGCPVPLSQLRYLKVIHRNAEGKTQLGEMICNMVIADKLLRIFRQLYDADYKIERMQLIDDYDADDEKSMTTNNTSCFNFRVVAGTQTVSKHGKGLAVDINPLYNPCVKTRNGVTTVQPEAGTKYAHRRAARNDIPYKIDRNDLAYRLFNAEGFTWGGDWRSLKDYQHFEYSR